MWILVVIIAIVCLLIMSVNKGRRGKWTMTPLVLLPIFMATCLLLFITQDRRVEEAQCSPQKGLAVQPEVHRRPPERSRTHQGGRDVPLWSS